MQFFLTFLFLINIVSIILIFLQNDIAKEIDNFNTEVLTFGEIFLFVLFFIQLTCLLIITKL
jgi:hypothetical protein